MDTSKPSIYETTDAPTRQEQTKVAKMVAVLPRIEAARARGWRWHDLLDYARDLLGEPNLHPGHLKTLVYTARRRVAAAAAPKAAASPATPSHK